MLQRAIRSRTSGWNFAALSATTLRERRLTVLGESQPLYMMVSLWVMAFALIMPFMAEPLCVRVEARAEDRRETSRPMTAVAPAAPASAAAMTSAPARNLEPENKITCAAGQTVNPRRGSQFFMIFLLSSFFSFLLLMLHDVADTRRGFWRVDRRSFRGLRRELVELYNSRHQ